MNYIWFIIEPFSFLLNSFILFYYCWKINYRFKYRVLTGFNFVAAILLAKASQEGLQFNTNVEYYNFLYLLSSLCLGYYFYTSLLPKLKKIITLLLCGITILYFIFNNPLFSKDQLFDSMGYVISSMGITIMILMLIHQIMTNVNEEPLSLNFDFWFICSQMVYHLGSFVIFLTYNYLTQKIIPQYIYKNRELLTYLWTIPNVLLFLSSLITCTGVLWIAYSRKSSLS